MMLRWPPIFRSVIVLLMVCSLGGCRKDGPSSAKEVLEESNPVADESAQSADADSSSEPCVAKLRETIERAKSYSVSSILPAIDTPEEELVELSTAEGEPLVKESLSQEELEKLVFVEVLPNQQIRIDGDDKPVSLAGVAARWNDYRQQRQKESQILGNPKRPFPDMVFIAPASTPAKTTAAVIEEFVAPKGTLQVSFAYRVEGEPPPTIERPSDEDRELLNEYQRSAGSLFKSADGTKEHQEVTKKLHDRVFGPSWNKACHMTWNGLQHGSYDAEDTGHAFIDTDERQCCSDVDWDLLAYWMANGAQVSYQNWHLLPIKLQRQTVSPSGAKRANEDNADVLPVAAIDANETYEAFLKRVASHESTDSRFLWRGIEGE